MLAKLHFLAKLITLAADMYCRVATRQRHRHVCPGKTDTLCKNKHSYIKAETWTSRKSLFLKVINIFILLESINKLNNQCCQYFLTGGSTFC